MTSGPALTIDCNKLDDALRAELRRLLSAPGFGQSPVMSRLLTFLVDETLAGRGDALKAYVVAVEGLGRAPEFDPETDSYPRVQVGRLRKLLAAHYALHPAENPCLHIPLGAYRVFLSDRRVAYPTLVDPVGDQPVAVPVEPVIEQGSVDKSSVRWLIWPGLAAAALFAALAVWAWRMPAAPVASIETHSPVVLIHTAPSMTGRDATGSAGLGEVAMATLADGLRRSWVLRPLVDGPAARAREAEARYAIEAQAGPVEADGRFHLFVRLMDQASGAVIWSTDRVISSNTNAMRSDMAGLIAQIGSPFGIVAQAERSRLGANASPGYPCLLLYGTYYRTREDALRRTVARCLQQPGPEAGLLPAIESGRAIMIYATADTPAVREQKLDEAKAIAAQALARRWDSADALFTSASLAFYRGECERGSYFAERAIRANPYNPNMFGALGVLIYPCDRQAARTYLETARALEPDGPPNFRVPLLIMAIEGDTSIDMKTIVTELETTAQAGPAYKALGRALVAAGRGDRATARRQWQRVWDLAPTRPASDDELLRSYILSDPLRAIALDQLRKGGALKG
jgi:tetratricopeptide (TPR) repeat protein